ncbi:hypothetical protein EC988_001366, partial [Linderina pennispora]
VPEDIETGLLNEQPVRRQPCRGKKVLKRLAIFLVAFFTLRLVLFHAVHHNNGQLMRSVFGNERVDRWMAKHPCHGGEQWGKMEGGSWVDVYYSNGQQPTKQIEETVAHILEQINRSVRPAFQMMASSRINHTALAALSRGELAATDIDSLFRVNHNDICVPIVPVEGLETFTFDPTKFTKISQVVRGGIGSSVRIVSTSASEATFSVRALASDPKIAEQISLKQTTDEEGNISFVLDGPKILRQGECAYADIVLSLPSTLTSLDLLRTGFVYGQFDLDSKLARAIDFGKFEVNSVTGKLQIPPIHGEDLAINTVTSDVHGHYFVRNSINIHTVKADINVGVNVAKAPKSTIVIETVSGAINTRVSGGFDGSFLARNIVGGRVSVEDASDGSNRLHFVKDHGNYKSGTFGPADSTQAGESVLRANAISGEIYIEFN